LQDPGIAAEDAAELMAPELRLRRGRARRPFIGSAATFSSDTICPRLAVAR